MKSWPPKARSSLRPSAFRRLAFCLLPWTPTQQRVLASPVYSCRSQMANKFRVALIYPRRDPDSQVRTQFSQEHMHGLLLWPFKVRTYGLAFNGLETLAALTPDWV